MALRFDTGTTRGVEKTPEGFARVTAALTRTGVLRYRDKTGREWGELRPAEEVFHADSLASLHLRPVTDGHPPEMVSAKTVRAVARGRVGPDVRADGQYVVATLLVEDAEAVELIERGERRDISAGYACEIDPTPGITPEGERYDAIQRSIRYNHAALLPPGAGRAGTDVSLRLDGAAVEVTAGAPARETKPMLKIKIAGREYRLDDDAAVAEAQAAVETHEQTLKGATDSMQKLLTDAMGVNAQMAAKVAAMEAEKAAAAPAEPTEAVLDAKIAEREQLRADARKVLGADAKLDGLKPIEIKRAVVAKALPSSRLDGIAEPVLDGMFAALVATHRNDALAATHAAAVAGTRADAEDPELAMKRRSEERWKQPTTISLDRRGA